MNARQRLKADLDRFYAHYETWPNWFARLRINLETEGIWAVWCLRFGQYLRQEASLPVRALLEIPYRIIWRLIGYVTGIHLYPGTSVGPGLYIGHYGGIWISPRVTLGANCSISQGVTIGVAGRDRSRGPILGDRVWIGPNAVITGKITIGSGAVIGANSLVASNVPENGVVLGVPAKIISRWGSGHLIVLPDREDDTTED